HHVLDTAAAPRQDPGPPPAEDHRQARRHAAGEPRPALERRPSRSHHAVQGLLATVDREADDAAPSLEAFLDRVERPITDRAGLEHVSPPRYSPRKIAN